MDTGSEPGRHIYKINGMPCRQSSLLTYLQAIMYSVKVLESVQVKFISFHCSPIFLIIQRHCHDSPGFMFRTHNYK